GRETQLQRHEQRVQKAGIGLDTTDNSVDAFAGNETVTDRNTHLIEDARGSLLQAGNQVQLNAGQDIRQTGSDVLAGNNVTYNAGGDIQLHSAQRIEIRETSQTLERDGLSVSLEHNYGKTRDALKNAGEGEDNTARAS